MIYNESYNNKLSKNELMDQYYLYKKFILINKLIGYLGYTYNNFLSTMRKYLGLLDNDGFLSNVPWNNIVSMLNVLNSDDEDDVDIIINHS